MDLIFLQKNARAKKARIHFFGIYESPKDTNSIFLQSKNAQNICVTFAFVKNGTGAFWNIWQF